MDETSWPVLTDWSNCCNCASCVTNVVLSMGWVGSWFCSCATRSCRNIFWVTAGELEDDVCEVPVVGGVEVLAMGAIIKFLYVPLETLVTSFEIIWFTIDCG